MIGHKLSSLWIVILFSFCFPCDGNAENLILYPFGDSITKGWAVDPNRFGYRDHLQIALKRKYDFVGPFKLPRSENKYDVDHSGYSGQRTDQLKERLKENLPQYLANVNSKKSAILIHAGTNDIDQDYGTGSLVEKVDSYVKNIREMIDIIDSFNPNINIFTALIIPINDTRNSKVALFNDRLATMLRHYGKENLYIVDMYSAFARVPAWSLFLMGDALHPNDKGYSIMGKMWASHLNSL